MSEPIYEFVKGEGWVVSPAVETRKLIMLCGTKIRIEKRMPNLDEVFVVAPSYTMDQFEAHLSVCRFSTMQGWHDQFPGYPPTAFITVVPL